MAVAVADAVAHAHVHTHMHTHTHSPKHSPKHVVFKIGKWMTTHECERKIAGWEKSI